MENLKLPIYAMFILLATDFVAYRKKLHPFYSYHYVPKALLHGSMSTVFFASYSHNKHKREARNLSRKVVKAIKKTKHVVLWARETSSPQ